MEPSRHDEYQNNQRPVNKNVHFAEDAMNDKQI